MRQVDTDVNITNLPNIIVELSSPVDFITIGSFILTAFIVIASSYMTIRSLTKTLEKQREIANDNNKKEVEKSYLEQLLRSRQHWINNLRDDVSSYIATISRADIYQRTNSKKVQILQKQSGDTSIKSIMSLYDSSDLCISEARSLQVKISLHLNLKEIDSITLLEHIVDAFGYIANDSKKNDGDKSFEDILLDIERQTQKIIKTEWERIKLKK